jgi:ferredoxin
VGVIVRFLRADGSRSAEARVEPGTRLLDVAQAAGQPLEGTCNGQMACSTCHVILDPVSVATLPRTSPEEDDLLDLAPGATSGSRLACQVWLSTNLGELTVRLPSR